MYEISVTNGSVTSVIHELDPDSDRRLLSGKFTGEVNSIPSFDFTISPFNPCYDNFADRVSIVTVVNTKTTETEFEGPVLLSEKQMTSSGKVYKSVTCEGYLGYLCDSIQPYHHYEGYTVVEFVTALLDQHNALVSEEKRIYLGSCDFSGDNTNSKTTAYRTTLEELKVNLVERIGGEIRIRKVEGRLVLDFLTQYGSNSSTVVELADNLISLDVKTDATSIITRLIPLGAQLAPDESAERLDISAVNNGKIYIDDAAAMAKYGVIVGKVEFDDITLPANLLTAAQDYLTNNNRVQKAYKSQVLDLSPLYDSYENFREGNTYRFRNRLLGLDEDLRLIRRTVDIYKPHKPTVEIGDRSERITDISVRTTRLIEYDMPQQKIDILASAKATATALIDAGINGYVVVNKNEILIMDTPDKETATKVWRWNSGGFGYSNTGYHGTYGTAITMNGAIVADYITAGVLRGIEIVNGNGTFRVDTNGNVTASAMTITGGVINNGNGTFRVAADGTVNASAINITGGVINNGNGTFMVAANGTVNASAINITGGSINITTNSESYDVIQLSCGDWSHKFSPLEWRLTNDNTDCEVLAQAGAMYFRSNGDNTVYIGAASGDVVAESLYYKKNGTRYNVASHLNTDAVSADTVDADTVSAYDIQIKENNGGSVFSYSLLDTIASLQRQIDDLRGV